MIILIVLVPLHVPRKRVNSVGMMLSEFVDYREFEDNSENNAELRVRIGDNTITIVKVVDESLPKRDTCTKVNVMFAYVIGGYGQWRRGRGFQSIRGVSGRTDQTRHLHVSDNHRFST